MGFFAFLAFFGLPAAALGLRLGLSEGCRAGLSAREMAALAAERRASGWRQGGAPDPNKSASLRSRSEKEVLVGRIEAHYAARGTDPPFGLMAASVEVEPMGLRWVSLKERQARGNER